MSMDQNASQLMKRGLVRIMLVDDHPNTAITLARAVSRLRSGIEVSSATSGKEALEFADQGGIDILITDMMMPGMNGFELIERLQAHPTGRPIHTILMTAYDVPGLRETARRLNIQDIIIKPVPTERICQIVNQVLDHMGRVNLPIQPAEKHHHSKIMVADDIPDNVILLSRYLKNEGYDYIPASNGIEVLEKARLEMPDLILLDINMPEKDGLTALEELRADPQIQHIPVIVLTAARPTPDDIQWGLSLGADDYITKPFDRRELLARIRTKLRVKEAEDITRRRNRELSVLPEIGKELSARLDINELSDVVLHRTVETLGAMMGHIIILNPNGPIHKKYHISALTSTPQEVCFPPLNDLMDHIKETRRGLIIEDTRTDPHWQAVPDNPALSITIVPMFGRLDLIGLLILTHEQTGYFKLEHLLLLQAIASQAAIAIENAQLYERMAEEQQRFAAILQGAADAIMLFDADSCLSLLNPAAQKLFTDDEGRLGLPLMRGCGYDALIDALAEVGIAGTTEAVELRWPDQRVFSARFTPIERGGCVVLLHDISHFKTLERVKNEFISTASHDLKNPITTILGFSDLISKAGPLNEYQTEFAHRIRSSAEHMKELVQNLLDLARVDMGLESKKEIVNINSMLQEIRDEFQPQAKMKEQVFQLQATSDPLEVSGDPLQLRQVVRNLVGNAIKYTPANGTVGVSAGSRQNSALLHVMDTGYGIPSSDLPHVFERFYRVRNNGHDNIEGNGLGLAIVKSIVEQHGGQVSVESEPGRGSCFSVTLPLIHTAESVPENANSSNLQTIG